MTERSSPLLALPVELQALVAHHLSGPSFASLRLANLQLADGAGRYVRLGGLQQGTAPRRAGELAGAEWRACGAAAARAVGGDAVGRQPAPRVLAAPRAARALPSATPGTTCNVWALRTTCNLGRTRRARHAATPEHPGDPAARCLWPAVARKDAQRMRGGAVAAARQGAPYCGRRGRAVAHRRARARRAGGRALHGGARAAPQLRWAAAGPGARALLPVQHAAAARERHLGRSPRATGQPRRALHSAGTLPGVGRRGERGGRAAGSMRRPQCGGGAAARGHDRSRGAAPRYRAPPWRRAPPSLADRPRAGWRAAAAARRGCRARTRAPCARHAGRDARCPARGHVQGSAMAERRPWREPGRCRCARAVCARAPLTAVAARREQHQRGRRRRCSSSFRGRATPRRVLGGLPARGQAGVPAARRRGRWRRWRRRRRWRRPTGALRGGVAAGGRGCMARERDLRLPPCRVLEPFRTDEWEHPPLDTGPQSPLCAAKSFFWSRRLVQDS
eukprot:scaffold125440_cov69-Phaeocystis_antarctica.AAC.4